ncbi:hypothetical protein MRB53_007110 [Persea americana]|uniref:Uncharacterized protein n=1 Tax=Persea americana TaxID=3435 RepID=A0ACC2MJP2_PERAE|nr:hypothetical protein MRB53_007110 [Persea americana]
MNESECPVMSACSPLTHMLHLAQTPCRALSARRPPLSSPLLTANPKPPLFSHHKSGLSSSNNTPKTRLTLANADAGADPNRPLSPAPPFSADEKTVSVGEDGVPLEGVIQFEKPNSSSSLSQLNSWGRVALLSGGDVLGLLLFAAAGRFSHGLPVLDVETLHTADPFIAGWFLGAYFLGGYEDDGKGVNGLTKAVFAAVKSWAVGIPLGVIIRAATSSHIPPASFVLVTMGSTGILLIGWRALISTLLPYDQRKKNDVYRRGSPFELFELLTSLVRRW